MPKSEQKVTIVRQSNKGKLDACDANNLSCIKFPLIKLRSVSELSYEFSRGGLSILIALAEQIEVVNHSG